MKAAHWTRRRMVGAGLGGGLAWALAATARAQPSSARVALVIGNAAYAGAQLPNATNDARSMGRVLQSLGFQVIEVHDGSKVQMNAAVAQARDLLQGREGVGLLYYAGHGLQVDWHNYLVPVDATPVSAADVPRQTVNTQTVIDAFRSAGNRVNILVLDACRDNPFGASASAKGLAPLDAPSGTFLAYATAPGHVAEDGSLAEGNGLYTRHLLQELQRPGAPIEEVFKRVRLQVRQASQGRQIPWESTSLENDFVFASGQRLAAPTTAERERMFTEEKAAWDLLAGSREPGDFFAFLRRYPRGDMAEMAHFRLDQLQTRQVSPVAGPTGPTQLPAGQPRYRVGDVMVHRRTDHLTGQVQTVTQRVTAADESTAQINGGALIFDQMGGVLRNRSGSKEPAYLQVPADLALGKRWRSAFTNTLPSGVSSRNFYDSSVTALERLNLPAGDFTAFRVESVGEAVFKDRVLDLRATMWIDPTTMWIVRADRHFSERAAPFGSRDAERSSGVLMSMQRAPR
ncbi:MAG: caspase family protein [Rubrivivax sp.]|nr:caspase family protein [Rubrivivax sp.]